MCLCVLVFTARSTQASVVGFILLPKFPYNSYVYFDFKSLSVSLMRHPVPPGEKGTGSSELYVDESTNIIGSIKYRLNVWLFAFALKWGTAAPSFSHRRLLL